MQAPRLRRGLFGYRGRSVRLALAARDGELARVSERALEMGSRAADLAAELEEVRAEADRQRSDLHARLDVLTLRAEEAEGTLARREALADELRFGLAASRRLFLQQVARTRSVEAALEDLAAELWQVRAQLEAARAPEAPSGPIVVLPDLGGNGAPARPDRVAGSL
jgi:hypothetical protein